MSERELTSLFFEELKKHPQLQHDDLVKLFQKLDIDNTNNTIRNQIAEANLRLVVSIAKQYMRHQIPLLDLVQEGNIGLLTAIGKFRWERGFRFSTYASWWIKQAIQQHILKRKRLIRLPAHAATVQRKLIKASEAHRDRTGEEPTNEELLEAVQASKTVVQATLRSGRSVVSLSQAASQGHFRGPNEDTIEERLEDTSVVSQFDSVSKAEMLQIATGVLNSLSTKEMAIIRLRSGLISDIDDSEYEITTEEEQIIIDDFCENDDC